MTLDRRRTLWIAGGVVFVVLLATVGVWREIDREVGDTVFVPGFDVALTDADRVATTVLAGSDWVFERATPTDGSDCVRLRIGDRATQCVPTGYSGGGWSVGVVRAPDGRHFVQLLADPSVATVRLYTSAQSGASLTPLAMDEARNGVAVIVELGAGEEPWGLQLFDAEGDLISTTSLLGSLG